MGSPKVVAHWVAVIVLDESRLEVPITVETYGTRGKLAASIPQRNGHRTLRCGRTELEAVAGVQADLCMRYRTVVDVRRAP